MGHNKATRKIIIMPKTVLTIDDDTAITELLAMLLRTHGYEVKTVNSGEEGVDAIKKYNPHVVILDLMMPGLDGWQVCKIVREFSNVPIVILSALDDPAMIASALDAGADDYLVKPVSSSVLVAHLNRLIRRTGTLEATNGTTIRASRSQPQTP
jgi:DNA-binding response OmpR family regulator